ncbi:hypothetical protein VTJ49DRAFT_6822 [Mycothermus thermophilus]|uniref:Uncharacterized protein n=1 Tax=Humicola insolens TaxID=85995 RepID=A0ABR3V0X6_HUMIN
MATLAEDVPRYAGRGLDSLGPEDIETASIHSHRSAAPSYTSDAPSYHTINPHPDPLPPYTPPATSTPANTTNTRPATTYHTVSSLLDLTAPPPTSSLRSNSTGNINTSPNNTNTQRTGLPSIPVTQPRRHSHSDLPSISHFRIPPWSPASSASRNPNARIYQNVALRRAAAAASGGSSSNSSSAIAGNGSGMPSPYHIHPVLSSSSSSSSSTTSLDGLMRTAMMLERIEEEEQNRVRPLEDPYLVGEEAAARARAERMARERLLGEDGGGGGGGSGGSGGMDWGEAVLVRENRRWDLFLAQMKDREDRERSWRRVRRDAERRLGTGSSSGSGSRLSFRIGARF